MNSASPPAQLSPSEKRRLLEELTNKGASAPVSYPMSFSQRRLWFLDQLNPGNPFYNVESVVPISGPLDVVALEKAINAIIERHAVLRTVFREIEDEPRQVVRPSLAIRIGVVDLSSLSKPQQDRERERIVTEDAREPFDLANGPLIRAKILVLGHNDRLFQLRMHHIVADGWSMGLFANELKAFYGKFAFGWPAQVPKLSIQYADYAVWQRKWLSGEKMQTQLDYWKHQLEGLEVLALPTDFQRPTLQSYRGAFYNVHFPKRLADRIKALGREENCTSFMTLLAAFNVILHRWSTQEDIVIGTYIANRQRAEVESLIGFFLNTLVLRTRVCSHDTFRQLMRAVRDMALSAYENQDLPFETLVEKLQPDRDLSRNPLFQVTFQLSNTPTQTPGTDSHQALDFKRGTAIFDLAFMLFEVPDGLAGQFEYSTDLFSAATIQRLAEQYGRLLEQVVEAPGKPVSDYVLISPDETQNWLEKWNDPFTSPPSGAGLADLLAEVVRTSPDQAAYVTEDSQLSFQELDSRSNQLAHYLQTSGVGPEVVVAVCMDRTLDLIVTLWGIVKSGGAWLALDPELPPERMDHMVQVAQTKMILVDAAHRKRFPEAHLPVAVFEEIWPETQLRPATLVPLPADWDRLAYVIFTSGSTGRPKGIGATHRQIVSRLWWMWREYPFEPGACGVFKTAISFVDSIWELFGYALRGVPCAVAPARVVRDPIALVEFLARQRVTHFWFVPSLLRVLLDVPDLPNLLPHLRFAVSSGEPLPMDLHQRFTASFPAARLFNLYGTSEIWDATWCEPRRLDLSSGRLPIGRPIQNVETFILDAKQRLVPPGLPGELCVGGWGLARGYLADPELTQAKFVDVELAPGVCKRLYRTGDQARLRADGHIELLERIDQQVKIRGYRIELADIESTMCTHEAIALAAARAVSVQHDQRIVAWYTTRNGSVPPAELRAFLEKKLPSYMIPWRCIPLSVMPLTTSGKINRKALEVTDRLDQQPNQAAPQGTLEQLVAAIWAEVLGVPSVARDANFFGELAGHSLIATQAVSRLRDTLQHEVALRMMFEHTTVASFAQALREHPEGDQLEELAEVVLEMDRQRPGRHAGQRFRLTSQQRQLLLQRKRLGVRSSLQALKPALVTPSSRMPLSSPQQRLWLLEQMLPKGKSVAIETLTRFSGPYSAALLLKALKWIVKRHDILRASFHEEQGSLFLEIKDSVDLLLPDLDLRHRSPDEQVTLKMAEIQACRGEGFDLARPPLIKLRLFRLADNQAELFLRIHHVITDGWSMGIFAQELKQTCLAVSTGREPDLPPLTAQYTDFIRWQQEQSTGERREGLLSYWREQLRDLTFLPLPTDRPRPRTMTFNGAHARFQIEAATYGRLEVIAAERGCTPFMVLLAGFKVLLSQYCGTSDIAIGTYVSNRDRQEFENVIGLFLNVLVLRTSLADARSFPEALARVRQTTLGAFAHQAMPFDELVRELRVPRDTSRNPLVQVLFQLNNAFGQTGTLDEAMAAFEIFDGVAPFDLSIMASPTPQGVACLIEFNTDLFERRTIDRLTHDYGTLLGAIAQNPELDLARLPVSAPAPVAPAMASTDAPPAVALRVVTRPVEANILRQIKTIWQAVLGQDEINEAANFFEIGGHSLLAIQVTSRIKDALQIELPLNLIFEFSTLRDLAAEISARSEQRAAPGALHIPRLSRDQYRRG